VSQPKNRAKNKTVSNQAADKLQHCGRAERFFFATGVAHDVTDDDALMGQTGGGAEETNEGGCETEQAELLRAQITRDPDPDDQPHAHAQDLVEKQPADVIDDLQQIWPMLDAAADERWNKIHAISLRNFHYGKKYFIHKNYCKAFLMRFKQIVQMFTA